MQSSLGHSDTFQLISAVLSNLQLVKRIPKHKRLINEFGGWVLVLSMLETQWELVMGAGEKDSLKLK